MKAIINGKIILENEILKDKILLFDKKIIDVVDNFDRNKYEIIDAKGKFVSPGFIDVHVHGAMGYDTMDADLEGLKTIGKRVIKNGVTSFLPTTMTMEKEKIYRALDVVREFSELEDFKGAYGLGAHVEGPFINPVKKGAQNGKFIVKPTIDLIKEYLDLIKIVSYAPEMDIDNKFLKEMKSHQSISLSLGHSNANFDTAMDAINGGARSFTHLFNAMTGLHHRNPGMVGAAFKADVYAEIIADNVHVNPELFDIVMKEMNNKLVLITDGMSAKCMKPGEYELGGQKVIVDKTSARLVDGTLAGSILELNIAVRNLKNATNRPLYKVVNCASLNPAKLIKEDKMYGSIKIGKYADICIFDKDINISATFKYGEKVF